MKKLMSILMFLTVSLLAVSMVSALDSSNLKVDSVRVNGDFIKLTPVVAPGGAGAGTPVEVLAVEEGEKIKVRVGLVAGATGAKDVEVDAKIGGYEYSDYENLHDSTHLFDIAPNTTKYVNLEVAMPDKLEKDTYWLRLRILDKSTSAITQTIKLAVEPTRHGIRIRDTAFSQGTTVKAGRSLLATVLLENFGDKKEKDVKVTVSMPELGISATEFVDVVNHDNNNIDREDVPEMFLQIPTTAKPGDYQVKVTAEYDNYEKDTKSYTIKVIENERFKQVDKLVLAMYPDNQNVAAGSSTTYALGLTNAGTSSKTYIISAAAGDWGSVSASENLVILAPGKNKVVTLTVKANDNAAQGAKAATVVVKSGDDVLKTLVLKANVTPSVAQKNSGVGLRNGLEIALIVLVVLLIIVGLIIGFSRLRKDDDEDQTYY